MIAQPQQMKLDAISESIQKNVENNATVQRTETGNVLLPDGFPADAGGGKDQYGNVINNMAVTKSYVDSHAGGNIAWYNQANDPDGKNVLFQVTRTRKINVTLSNGETTNLILSIMAPGCISKENNSRIFVSALLMDNNYKYYATTGLSSNFSSGYKVFVNIYSVETGDKVGTYTELISTLNSISNYKYFLY